MGRIMILATALALASPAMADNDFAFDLGNVLGSEAACGLAYDAGAIERLVAKRTEPSDMDFLSSMNLAADVMTRDVEKMSASRRAAHCAQVRRVAESFGFLK